MALWNDRWFGGQVMPASSFPQAMLEAAQTIAEKWLFDGSFRCILTEWVSRSQADEEMGGILWSGFRLRGQANIRVAPKPVLVRLLFTEPYPIDTSELLARMREYFARAAHEWIQGHVKYGDDFLVAP